ncbi:hypothetical protein ACR78H_25060 [Sphingobacterium siyangense]|uniref:hypothetical protein n=1 Tax=Sphingobacterium siyangense TaxID=459529 RepID=UPI003DA41327
MKLNKKPKAQTPRIRKAAMAKAYYNNLAGTKALQQAHAAAMDPIRREKQQNINNTIADIIGTAGVLKFLIQEEYDAKITDYAQVFAGDFVAGFTDISRLIDDGMTSLKKAAEILEIRLIKTEGNEKAQNVHYGMLLAIKALLHRSEAQIYEEAILLSNAPVQFTRRSHFMEYFERVLDRARSSNHDAVQMIRTLYLELHEANIDPIKVRDDYRIEIKDLESKKEA